MAVALQDAAGLAPPPRVSEWVSRHDDGTLAAREQRIADIERSPVSDAEPEHPTLLESTRDVSSNGAPARTESSALPLATASSNRSAGRTVLKVSVASAVVVALSAAVAGLTLSRERAHGSDQEESAVTAANGHPHVDATPLPSSPVETRAADGGTGDAPEVAPVLSGTTVATTPTAATPPSATTTSPARPSGRRSTPHCDPPFTRDADGTKIYKRECL